MSQLDEFNQNNLLFKRFQGDTNKYRRTQQLFLKSQEKH